MVPIPRLVDKNDRTLKGCEVRLIDEDNEQLGIIPVENARVLASEKGLDLVLVGESSDPPVCRIMNYGKFVYERNKRGRDQRKKSAKSTKTANKNKEIKFHANIEAHDYNMKLNQIRKFLEKGFKVKASLFFRGREMRNKGLGLDLMLRVGKDVEDIATVESAPRIVGRNVGMFLSPLSKK